MDCESIKAASKCHIRWSIRRDVPEIVAIEQACDPYHLDEGMYRLAMSKQNVIGMVVEDVSQDGSPVVGHMLYELHDDLILVTNFAVLEAKRRHGFGRAMIDKLKHKVVHSHKRNRVVFEVPESCLGLQLFLRAMGFRAELILRHHLEDGSSVYRMAWHSKEKADE